MSKLALLLIFIFTSTGYAETCEDFFTNQSSCDYRKQLCHENIANLILGFKNDESLKDIVPGSKVLFLFDENFKNIAASPKIEPSGLGWRWHVVLDTTFGIVDAEEILSQVDQWIPVERNRYFEENYPHLDQIKARVIPAEIYLREYFRGYIYEPSRYVNQSNYRGWVKRHIESHTPPDFEPHLNPSGFIHFRTMVGSPIYYVISKEAEEHFPTIYIKDYLSQ